MDERFGSEFISQCCQILSSNYSREGEDEADHPLIFFFFFLYFNEFFVFKCFAFFLDSDL